MYALRRFHGSRFDRINAIIDSLDGHLTSYVHLIGSGTLPLPEVCYMQSLPASACRVEGHPGARLFPGTEPMDQAEALVEEGTRRLFSLDDGYAVSAQPHSATQANHAVFRAVLGETGGSVAGLSPSDGGHISHRLGVSSSTKFIGAPLTADGIDYDEFERTVLRHRPAILVAGGTSYTRAIDYRRLRQMADGVGCHLHADLAHTAPFVAAGQHPPAFPFADSATLDPSKNLRGAGGGILVYRDADAASIRRAIFPVLQSAPNQSGLLAKVACINHWTPDRLRPYAERMVRLARILGERVATLLGPSVYGETETHLLLFDTSPLSIDGRAAEEALERARILANRNQIPGDENPPWAPSGIRFGSTVLAILEYTEEDVGDLGDAICSVLAGGSGHDETIARLLETYHRPIVNTASG
jgi:glycine hydroxymethyltransferase